VPDEIAHEKHPHAQHEGNAGHAHQADICGEEIFESMHGQIPKWSDEIKRDARVGRFDPG
jgi:hypothetical protein